MISQVCFHDRSLTEYSLRRHWDAEQAHCELRQLRENLFPNGAFHAAQFYPKLGCVFIKCVLYRGLQQRGLIQCQGSTESAEIRLPSDRRNAENHAFSGLLHFSIGGDLGTSKFRGSCFPLPDTVRVSNTRNCSGPARVRSGAELGLGVGLKIRPCSAVAVHVSYGDEMKC